MNDEMKGGGVEINERTIPHDGNKIIIMIKEFKANQEKEKKENLLFS